jgi:mannose-6-phosphate isomerase
MSLRRLEPKYVERVWGRTDLAPLYGKQDRCIGEVWFQVSDDFPLLVKFLFTSERLSIQVHPGDQPGARGKTEMWHILLAEPGATIALGFREPVTKDQLRSSLADGSIEQLVDWVPVKEGDTLYAGAGTVHAIGGGIVLCEIQQNSDCTYRLWDYGRPRELHIDAGLACASTGPCDGFRQLPVVAEHFITDVIEADGPSGLPGEHLLITLEGTGKIAGLPYRAGEVWYVPAGYGLVEVASDGPSRILRTRCGG